MKIIYFLLFSAVIALSSCSSSYRSGQTPDDVYYSPGRQAVSNNGEYYSANSSDQYLMMKAQDPNRWSYFDDYDYGYGYYPYSGFGMYGFYGGYSPWLTFGYWNPYYYYLNSYYMWNSFYNPYYGGVIVVNTKYPAYNTYTQLHPFALSSYTNTALNNRNGNTGITRFYTPAGSTLRTTSNTNFTRNSFYNNQNSNLNRSNFQQQPSRSYSPSSFGGGSRFGGGGGGRSFSRPGKG